MSPLLYLSAALCALFGAPAAAWVLIGLGVLATVAEIRIALAAVREVRK